MSNQFILTPFSLDQPYPELETLAQSDWILNKPVLPDGDIQCRMSTLHKRIAEYVDNAIKNGDRPVSISGDCCTTIGVLAGLLRAGYNPTLIWFDAHGDFNTWETTLSGFIGGMPLAMIVGLGEQTLNSSVNLCPLPETQVILTDGRDLDPKELNSLANSKVVHLKDSRSLLKYPLALDTRPLYIHFDVDIINPKDVPAMIYPAHGGPSPSELTTIFQLLNQTGRIVAVSMATWSPKLDQNGQSQEVCMLLLQTLINSKS